MRWSCCGPGGGIMIVDALVPVRSDIVKKQHYTTMSYFHEVYMLSMQEARFPELEGYPRGTVFKNHGRGWVSTRRDNSYAIQHELFTNNKKLFNLVHRSIASRRVRRTAGRSPSSASSRAKRHRAEQRQGRVPPPLDGRESVRERGCQAAA